MGVLCTKVLPRHAYALLWMWVIDFSPFLEMFRENGDEVPFSNIKSTGSHFLSLKCYRLVMLLIPTSASPQSDRVCLRKLYCESQTYTTTSLFTNLSLFALAASGSSSVYHVPGIAIPGHLSFGFHSRQHSPLPTSSHICPLAVIRPHKGMRGRG
jgi:hypothetical protein